MPQTLTPDQIDDFVNLTFETKIDPKRKSWIDISLDYQEYFFAERFQNKDRRSVQTSQKCIFPVQTDNLGTARHSGLFDTDRTVVKNLSQLGEMTWTKQTFNFTYDVHERVFQEGPQQIASMLEMREHAAYNSYFVLMEDAMFEFPSSTSDNPMPPSGIQYWIVQSTTTPAGGFDGGAPSGHTTVGNINPSTYTNWTNWAFNYSNVTPDDMLERTRTAIYKTNFKSPHSFKDLNKGKIRREYLTTYAVVRPLEKLAETRNTDLGVDLVRYAGSVVINGSPVRPVPWLDDSSNTTNNPLYGIDWNSFWYGVVKGQELVRNKPKMAADQHTVREVHFDNWGQFFCTNRRANFVGHAV